MPNQIVLEWSVDVAGSPFGAAEAATALGAVRLYGEEEADPVLGQLFGLTVDSDVTTPAGSTATRTLTLNMTTAAGNPFAPPTFACRPDQSIESQEIEPPYFLRRAVTLAGSFFVENGVFNVPTTISQVPQLNVGDFVQFESQFGVFYEVASVTATFIALSDPYSGVTTNSKAFKSVLAPVELDRLAIYSTSEHDTNGVATTPAIPAGAGCRAVEIQYLDSTGAGPFEAEAELTGKRPVTFVFDEPAGEDVAAIVAIVVADVGGFGNSVGQLTVVELSDALPPIPENATPGNGVGSIEGSAEAIGIENTFVALTDSAQMLIERSLAFTPPSYFALAQQGAVNPPLDGDFLVTTGSKNVKTVEDNTGALSPGDTLRFAFQPYAVYTVAAITPKILTLVEAFSGQDIGGPPNTKMPVGGTPTDVRGTSVIEKPSSATRVTPSPAAPPTNAQLAGPLGQYVSPGVAQPPPNAPLPPATFPAPTILSDFFTQTLQLALKGIPVSPAAITFI